MQGIFLFNKPVGISSAGFLNQLKRNYFGKVPVGHGGTLDPLASGLLVVGVGKTYTRQLSTLLKDTSKSYQATIVLGATSQTYDGEGPISKTVGAIFPDDKKIKKMVADVALRTKQIPPIFSAIKKEGKRAYDEARAGKNVVLESRSVSVLSFNIESIVQKSDTVEVVVSLSVSSGFYVRSFAHDVGEVLGVGGYLKGLVRTHIGEFSLNEALEAQDLDGEIELVFRVFGGVVGVGYRLFADKTAQKWALGGFARNIDGNTVEIVGQGKMAVLSDFLEQLNKGPNGAVVGKTESYFRKKGEKKYGFKF